MDPPCISKGYERPAPTPIAGSGAPLTRLAAAHLSQIANRGPLPVPHHSPCLRARCGRSLSRRLARSLPHAPLLSLPPPRWRARSRVLARTESPSANRPPDQRGRQPLLLYYATLGHDWRAGELLRRPPPLPLPFRPFSSQILTRIAPRPARPSRSAPALRLRFVRDQPRVRARASGTRLAGSCTLCAARPPARALASTARVSTCHGMASPSPAC